MQFSRSMGLDMRAAYAQKFQLRPGTTAPGTGHDSPITREHLQQTENSDEVSMRER
jgi:hypothetical protein